MWHDQAVKAKAYNVILKDTIVKLKSPALLEKYEKNGYQKGLQESNFVSAKPKPQSAVPTRRLGYLRGNSHLLIDKTTTLTHLNREDQTNAKTILSSNSLVTERVQELVN